MVICDDVPAELPWSREVAVASPAVLPGSADVTDETRSGKIHSHFRTPSAFHPRGSENCARLT